MKHNIEGGSGVMEKGRKMLSLGSYLTTETKAHSSGDYVWSVGIDTLCRHNFEHNRYIWEFENNTGIIGRNTGIIGQTFFQRRRG